MGLFLNTKLANISKFHKSADYQCCLETMDVNWILFKKLVKNGDK